MRTFQHKQRVTTWLVNPAGAEVGEPRTRVGMLWHVTSAGRLEARWVGTNGVALRPATGGGGR